MGGKRGCALKTAFALHVTGLLMLIVGCFTPFWSRVLDDASGAIKSHQGLFVSYLPGGNWTFQSFDQFQQAGSDKTILYLTLSASLALVTIFLQLLLTQSYAFALFNASCGRKYRSEWLMGFSLFSGVLGVVLLVLYEQYMGLSISGSAVNVKSVLDYSRAAVILFIISTIIAAFFTVCDRPHSRVHHKK